MSTDRCEHGNVISDSFDVYRCFLCEPVTEQDLEATEQAVQEQLDEELELRDRRISELERVVAELAFAAGLTFTPGGAE
jgi:hypothetical protein